MSKAEELLASLSETVNEHSHLVVDTETHFIIDPVTRGIELSEYSGKAIMQYDHASERFTFELPRYIEGHDTMLCNRVRVHYINIDGETGDSNSEPVELDDLRVDPENPTAVICSWLITRNATQLAGTLNFLVQYMCVSDLGVVDYEFHSNIYRDLPVNKNDRADESAVIEYSDIIEQWRAKLFGSGDSAVAEITLNAETQLKNIETEGAEQVAAVVEAKDAALAAIVAKGEETLASIPENYTTTHNIANRALRTRANAIVATAEGESIVAEDCSDDYLRGLHIYGRTTQVTTTGKQLFNNTGDTYSINGITFTSNADGSISIKGTSTGEAYYLFDFRNDIPVKGVELTASITGSDDVSVVVGYFTDIDVFVNDIATVNSKVTKTFVYPEEAIATRSFLAISKDKTINTTVYPLLRLSSVADADYEPYSGGFVSPSPEWVQELNSVENPEIVICGKNMLRNEFDPGYSETVRGVTFTINDDKSIHVHDTPTTAIAFNIMKDVMVPAGKYCLSGAPEVAATTFRLQVNYSDEYGVEKTGAVDMNNNPVMTLNVDSRIRAYIYVSATAGEVDAVFYPQLEYGTEATEYEPYNGQKLSLSRSLPAIPVTSGGNYTDSNGQQWIADEIDFERGVYIQRVKEFVLDGSNNFDIRKNQGNPDQWLYCVYSLGIDTSIDGRGLCSSLRYKTANSMNSTGAISMNDAGYSASNAYGVLYLNMAYLMTENSAEALREILVRDPITFVLALKTPIETPLTGEELLAFSQLNSNYPVTTVLNTENAYTGLVYNTDTKMYIDGKFNELFDKLRESGTIA